MTTIKMSGYSGLLPFILMLIGYYYATGNIKIFFLNAFLAYSAVILSFIGAVHWGVVLKEDAFNNATRSLLLAMMPSLIGWVALLCPPLIALIIFAIIFPCFFVYEWLNNLNILLPRWYLKLRVQLTLFVTIMQVIAIGLTL